MKNLIVLIAFLFVGCGPSFQLLPPNGYHSNTQDVKKLVFGGDIFNGGVIVAGASIRNSSSYPVVVDAGPFSVELKNSGKPLGQLQPGERADVVFRTYLRTDQWYSIDIAVSPLSELAFQTGKINWGFSDNSYQGLQYRNFLVVNSGNGVSIY